ncbi:MAG: zinc-binding dehydrogenase [Thermoanaerobaculia bacterium]|nr:MAG: zinc-binding dehydrogenase [Thermoanaerobaculia bacterium]MBZ0101411.1 zinc-binding dehydrogenase [Thermoanaerobaculia bacterium]
MHGFRIDAHGGPEALVWRQLPEPVAGPGQVVVAVRACAVNHLDLWVRNGVPGHRFPLPLVPGSEVSGTVAAFGPGVEGLALGDPVVVGAGVSCGECVRCLAGRDELCPRFGLLGEDRDGGYAERVAVPRRNVFPLPRGLSYAEAAAIPLVFLTAWHMLAARAELRAHEDVLLHAAGSGVTTAGIQIARLLGARRIFVTSSSADKLAKALALGATHGLETGAGDFARAVREATGGKGVDVVFDHVGGATLENSFKCLARGGRIVLCGATDRATAEVPLRAVFFKNLSLLGSTMGSLAELAHLLPWFESGELAPVVARILPLGEAPRAQQLLADRAVFGKVVLAVGDGATDVPRPKEV